MANSGFGRDAVLKPIERRCWRGAGKDCWEAVEEWMGLHENREGALLQGQLVQGGVGC